MTFPSNGRSRGERAGREDTSRRSAYQDESRRAARERELTRRSGKAKGVNQEEGVTYRPKSSTQGGARKRRVNMVTAIALVIAGVLIIRLGWVQVVWGPELSLNASEQRTRVYVDLIKANFRRRSISFSSVFLQNVTSMLKKRLFSQ